MSKVLASLPGNG